MELLSNEHLNKLSTARLLTLYRARRKHQHNLYSRITDCRHVQKYIKEKDIPEIDTYKKLEKYCGEIKAILDKREHVK